MMVLTMTHVNVTSPPVVVALPCLPWTLSGLVEQVLPHMPRNDVELAEARRALTQALYTMPLGQDLEDKLAPHSQRAVAIYCPETGTLFSIQELANYSILYMGDFVN